MSDLTLIIGNKNYLSWSLRPWMFLKHHAIPFEEKRFAGYGILRDDPEADYVENVLAQPCIREWMEAGRAEKEVIIEDEIDM